MTWPFENDTSAIINKLALAEINTNKQRNFLIQIIIFFASLLLSFSTILIGNATLETQIITRVNNSLETGIVIFAIAIVLLFTSGLAIKNIMYISVLQRTQEFAQLRTLGATYKQIIAIVNRERKKLSWKFILSGILLGFLCNIILPLDFYLLPSIFCTVFSGSFIWFTVFFSFRTPAKQAACVSPMAALKQNQKYNVNSKQKSKGTRVTPYSMGKKYFQSDYKKAIYTLLSLILSGVLMFVVFSVSSAINIEKLARDSYYMNSDLYLMLNSTADENSTYNLMKNSPFTESLRVAITKIYGVTNIYPSKMLDCEVFNPDIPQSTGIKMSLNSIMEEANFKNLLVEGELPYNQGTLNTIPVVVNRLSPYYKNTGFDLKLGDILSANVDTRYSNKQVQFSVCGFIENKDKGIILYTSLNYLDSLAEMNCDLAWYICIEKNQTESAVEKIKSLVSSDDRLFISILADNLSEYQTYFHNAKVVIIVLILLVSLFSFINLLNTCITNTIIRQYDYALLEATGMTKSEIKKMQTTENTIYFSGSLIGSCIIGIPLGYYLCNRIAQIPGLFYISYQFPWSFLVLYIIFILIIYGIMASYQKHIFLKHSVVERIRTIE